MQNYRGEYVPDPLDPLTARYARTVGETTRDPRDWWQSTEPGYGLVVDSDRESEPRPYRWAPPKRNAPAGFMAELQRALLTKPEPPFAFLAFVRDEIVAFVRSLFSTR